MLESNIPKKNITESKTNYLALKSMLTGKTDVAFSEEMSMRYFIKNLEEQHRKNIHFIKPDNAYTSEIVFALRKHRQDDLLQKINTGIEQIKKDGTYQKILNRWFSDKPF